MRELCLPPHCDPDSWMAHSFRAAHPTLVMLRHDTAAFVEQGAPLPAGTRSVRPSGMQIRVRGGRERHKLNEEIEESGT